ncbi:uncharacterized protein LOC127136861 [Lathyrus oleraceus]|uniref:uncharacterized protein LOC127136861 n=1 Tax=Pisum sativum TaxID=3888 RepID=UPI0021CE36AC|nr:uncharacterized protein LOC127136861 [Pisum sativum]
MVDFIKDGNSFSGNTHCRVKDGKNAAFWYNKWVGKQSLKDPFHELFASTIDPFCSVVDAGQWSSAAPVSVEVRSRVNIVWKISAPSNVLMFGWRWILNGLPTRDQLMKRRILCDDRDKCCVFCFKIDESKQHVFDNCDFSWRIWTTIASWLGLAFELSTEDLSPFPFKYHLMKVSEERRFVSVIWLVVVWNIWLVRNVVMLKENISKFEECRSSAMFKSWE